MIVDEGQRQHDDAGGQHAPCRGHNGAGQPRHPDAHKSGRVDGDGPGGHLSDGHDVGELVHGQPGVLVHHLLLDQRHGGIAAADAEQSDLEKAPEKLGEKHHVAPFALR